MILFIKEKILKRTITHDTICCCSNFFFYTLEWKETFRIWREGHGFHLQHERTILNNKNYNFLFLNCVTNLHKDTQMHLLTGNFPPPNLIHTVLSHYDRITNTECPDFKFVNAQCNFMAVKSCWCGVYSAAARGIACLLWQHRQFNKRSLKPVLVARRLSGK